MRARRAGYWNVVIWVAEFLREDPLETELRGRIASALGAVDGVAEEDREVWYVTGESSGFLRQFDIRSYCRSHADSESGSAPATQGASTAIAVITGSTYRPSMAVRWPPIMKSHSPSASGSATYWQTSSGAASPVKALPPSKATSSVPCSDGRWIETVTSEASAVVWSNLLICPTRSPARGRASLRPRWLGLIPGGVVVIDSLRRGKRPDASAIYDPSGSCQRQRGR
jgi:hypothetical protein